MENKIMLPRVDEKGDYYISYSQINSWKRSKRDYIRSYFFGESFEGNAYTDFGSLVGEALEHNDFSSFTDEEEEFLKKVPRYDRFEVEVRLSMDGFYVLGFIDTMKMLYDHKGAGHLIEGISAIADYKTGSIEKKIMDYDSDDYIQLDLYAMALQERIGKLPEKMYVYLIGRSGNAYAGEELTLDKRFVEIEKHIDQKRVDQVKSEVQKIAEEISDYYKVFLKLNKTDE